MTIKIGERLPNATLRLLTPDGPKPVETKDYFAGKTVVLFGLPGAFTPTCHKNHLPGFIVNEERFKAKGVDKIAMTAVNDHHVLKAWAEARGAAGPSRRQRRLRQSDRPRPATPRFACGSATGTMCSSWKTPPKNSRATTNRSRPFWRAAPSQPSAP